MEEEYSINAEFEVVTHKINLEKKSALKSENIETLDNNLANHESQDILHLSPNSSQNEASQNIVTSEEPNRQLESKDSTSFLKNQTHADLNCLVEESQLRDIIKTDPWKINVKQTLDHFQKRMYENSEIKFRIGGRVIHSASLIVKAKSTSVIQDSHDTQDQLQINELDEDNLDDFDEYSDDGNNYESLGSILGSLTSGEYSSDGNLIIYDDEQIKAYVQERDSALDSVLSKHAYYSVDRDGRHFLASPVRKVFRKIELGDLGRALIKTLNYQLKSPRKSNFNELSKKLSAKILNENMLKKAEEERALVELQIQKMLDKINKLFTSNEPISFLNLIIAPDPDGIVRTLLYLLQLVNRKKVELWQKIDENDENRDKDKEDIGIDIFVTPYEESLSQSEESNSQN